MFSTLFNSYAIFYGYFAGLCEYMFIVVCCRYIVFGKRLKEHNKTQTNPHFGFMTEIVSFEVDLIHLSENKFTSSGRFGHLDKLDKLDDHGVGTLGVNDDAVTIA